MSTQTRYQHKHDKNIIKTFLELQKEFLAQRYADDEFAREYASHEINQWLNHNYEAIQVESENEVELIPIPELTERERELVDVIKKCMTYIFTIAPVPMKTPFSYAREILDKHNIK